MFDWHDFVNVLSDANECWSNWCLAWLMFFRLLTPPGTPLFPSLEMETRKTVMSQLGTPTARPTALKSRVSIFNEAFKFSGHVNCFVVTG